MFAIGASEATIFRSADRRLFDRFARKDIFPA